jgi:hypothetical protein
LPRRAVIPPDTAAGIGTPDGSGWRHVQPALVDLARLLARQAAREALADAGASEGGKPRTPP